MPIMDHITVWHQTTSHSFNNAYRMLHYILKNVISAKRTISRRHVIDQKQFACLCPALYILCEFFKAAHYFLSLTFFTHAVQCNVST